MSCEIKFARAHVRARSHMCDVRAKMVSKCACDVRACGRFMGVRRAITNSHVFGSNRPYFARFFLKKDLNFSFSHYCLSFYMAYCAWNGVKPAKKCKVFALKLHFCYKCACACANFGKTHTQKRTRACACAIRILAKHTRACDVRAAKIAVCERACMRAENPSQLSLFISK